MKVGILGGGQLGRMLALAGVPLGFSFRFLDPAEDAPVDGLGERTVAEFSDLEACAKLAAECDVVTFEFENVPAGTVEHLAQSKAVFPGATALRAAQDRVAEKRLFEALGIPVPPFAAVDTLEELAAAIAKVGVPAVVKTRREGYDGRGQRVVREAEAVGRVWGELGGAAPSAALLVESFVPFDRELSILAVRGRNGDIAFYPLVENEHSDGILRVSRAPAERVDGRLQERAESYARGILERLDYVGVVALELFQVGDRLLANEMAPRVHNSGHWTIEGAETSQFENHLRAIAGLPLGSTEARGFSTMVNLIGTAPELSALLAVPGAHVHLYGKEARAGRKLGHVTVVDASRQGCEGRARQVLGVVEAEPSGPLDPKGEGLDSRDPSR